MTTIVRIRIVVFEDDVQVDEAKIGYYRGQPYRVELATPDGTDLRFPMDGYTLAGEDVASEQFSVRVRDLAVDSAHVAWPTRIPDEGA